MKHTLFRRLVGALCATLFALPASAAYIAIDDSDRDTITITAGDFEEGFSVNGVLLTMGIGDSGTITLADGGYSISGSWIDLGASAGTRVDLLFALATNPGFTTSGLEFGASSDGFLGSLTGSFGGYIDPSLYFSTVLPTLAQNGQTGYSGTAYLSVSFRSEVPVPATALLLVIGALGATVCRRKP